MTTKPIWRRWAKAIRRPPTAGENEAIFASILANLAQDDLTVLTYRPMSHEPDLDQLAQYVDPIRLLTTRTPDTGPLTVHRFDSPSELHRFGFSQPHSEAPAIDPAILDMVLVPGVLFGRDGTRLGHGRGYYDRLLAKCRPDVLAVGVALEADLVSSLPSDPHDVSMTHLVTELGTFTIS